MNKIQEKLACTHPNVRHYGKRRRQCVVCKQTWRVWKCKRGRKQLRVSIKEAAAFIEHCTKPVRKGSHTRNRAQRHLAASRRLLVNTLPFPPVPDGETLILIADAFVRHYEGAWHTWYVMLVRTQTSDQAIILPPYHRSGTETVAGWNEAFMHMPQSVATRVVALVCDGHNGLVLGARRRSWLIQRCHFHILATLQRHRSRWKKGRNTLEATSLYRAVHTVLACTNENELEEALAEIQLLKDATKSRIVRLTLSGFLTNYRDYRTYLTAPSLNLPTTSNTAETLVGLIQELARRARGFRTVATFHEWIIAFVKVRRFIHCRGKHQPN
jgi:hypothetical protein